MSGALLLARAAPPHWPAWLVARGARAAAAMVVKLLVPLGALLLWAVSARAGWLPPQVLPPPDLVWGTLLDMARSGDLAHDAGISLWRVVCGFALGAGAGLALGAAMGLSRTMEEYIRPSFAAVAQVPTLGWIPLLMLPLGIGEPLKLAIIAKAALVPVALNARDGIRAVPWQWREVAGVFRYGRVQVLRRVVLPASAPQVFTGLRYGVTAAWKALVAVELLASSEGLGYQLVWGRQMMQMDVVLAAMAVIAAIGLALDTLLAAGERRMRRWQAA